MDLLTPKQHEKLLQHFENRQMIVTLMNFGAICLFFMGWFYLVWKIIHITFNPFLISALIGLLIAAILIFSKLANKKYWAINDFYADVYKGNYRCSVVTVGNLNKVRRSKGLLYLRDTDGREYICPFPAELRALQNGCQMVTIEVKDRRYIMRADSLAGDLTRDEVRMLRLLEKKSGRRRRIDDRYEKQMDKLANPALNMMVPEEPEQMQ